MNPLNETSTIQEKIFGEGADEKRPYTLGRLLELVAVRLPSPFTQTSGRYKKLSPRSVSFIATRGGSPKLLHSPVIMPDKFFQDFYK